MPIRNREPQTPILAAVHWSRDFLTFAVSGKCQINFHPKVSDIKAQCHAILGNFEQHPRDKKKIRRVWSRLKKME